MRFDWFEYFNLAQELAAISGDSANNDAKFRSAVSRAYYSVFCLARNYLRDVEKDPRLSRNKNPDINEHHYVAVECIFAYSRGICMLQVGENLSRLRELRNKGDYADTILNLSKDVQTALKLAQNIMSVLRELNQESEL